MLAVHPDTQKNAQCAPLEGVFATQDVTLRRPAAGDATQGDLRSSRQLRQIETDTFTARLAGHQVQLFTVTGKVK
jgi:hypothetical protein